MIAPKMEPIGRMPMSIDWATKESIVMPYYEINFLMGTEVISLTL